MSDVTVIGLGATAAALARTLRASGRSVIVQNRSRARVGPLVSAGAEAATSPRGALGASDLNLTCIRSHSDTRWLLRQAGADLAGRTVVELSTGRPDGADVLFDMVKAAGADFLIGTIASFPAGIGKAETAIVTAGKEAARS